MRGIIKIVVVITNLFAARAYAQACPPQYMQLMVEPEFAASTAAISAAMTAVDGALAAQLELQTQRTTSAIAVLTKQKAASANQIADTNRQVMQQLSTAMGVVSQNERVKKAAFDYSPQLGQGFSPCRVYAQRQVIANREAESRKNTRERVMSEITAAPGRYVEPMQARKAKLEENKKFCTQDQVDSGLCATVGALPGLNVNVATLFEASMENEPTYDAKVAFVNNVAPSPDAPLSTAMAKTPEGAAYSLAKARKDALVSPALAALKDIQLDYSGTASGETGTDLPLAVHYRTEVNRYNGNSEENNAWNMVLAAQNARGLMVELLKQKALDLAILEKQYRQVEQQEAMLAALVSLEVQTNGLTNASVTSANRAIQQNAINKIQP